MKKVESGFLGNRKDIGNSGTEAYMLGGSQSDLLAGTQLLSESSAGFFRLFVGRHFGRKVVIKTLKEDFAEDPVAAEQLRKEFGMMFQVDSPNIAQAYRLIDSPGSPPAIEMEWCQGEDIRELMNGNLTQQDALVVIRGVLAGLGDIHRSGIVHRDIKPENVMYDPFRRIVKIIDFGCAYVADGIALQGPNGTPGYTPEEKMNLDSESEPKDDLYAFGVMVGEMADSLAGSESGGSTRGALKAAKNLRRFSSRLLEGAYADADAAAYDFDSMIHRQRRLGSAGRVVVWILGALAMAGMIAFVVSDRMRAPQSSVAPFGANGVDSLVAQGGHPEALRPAEGESAVTVAAAPESVPESLEAPAPLAAPAAREEESGYRVTMPNFALGIVPPEDESIFNAGFAAGPLLSVAESKDATLKVKMDAFPLQFCDSIYRAERMNVTFPRSMTEDQKRSESKRLADKYNSKMEKEFHKRFGNSGDAHRRRVLMQARFYCTFSSYHSYPDQ